MDQEVTQIMDLSDTNFNIVITNMLKNKRQNGNFFRKNLKFLKMRIAE